VAQRFFVIKMDWAILTKASTYDDTAYYNGSVGGGTARIYFFGTDVSNPPLFEKGSAKNMNLKSRKYGLKNGIQKMDLKTMFITAK
jgi:hypothetical protein